MTTLKEFGNGSAERELLLLGELREVNPAPAAYAPLSVRESSGGLEPRFVGQGHAKAQMSSGLHVDEQLIHDQTHAAHSRVENLQLHLHQTDFVVDENVVVGSGSDSDVLPAFLHSLPS